MKTKRKDKSMAQMEKTVYLVMGPLGEQQVPAATARELALLLCPLLLVDQYHADTIARAAHLGEILVQSPTWRVKRIGRLQLMLDGPAESAVAKRSRRTAQPAQPEPDEPPAPVVGEDEEDYVLSAAALLDLPEENDED